MRWHAAVDRWQRGPSESLVPGLFPCTSQLTCAAAPLCALRPSPLQGRRPLIPPSMPFSPEAKEVMDTLK